MNDSAVTVPAYVDDWLAYRRRTLDLPGIAYAVGHAGTVVREGAHGVADLGTGEPMTVGHRFRIASQSKMFTATAVALLAKNGRLSLEDTVDRHLPGIGAVVGATTVRELLSHSGGVIRDGADARFWNLDDDFPAEETLAKVAGDELVLARRERFKYSNVGFALLGAVIAAVSGEGYQSFVATHLLRPLHLDATTPDLADDSHRPQPLATGHSSRRGGERRLPLAHRPALGFAPAAGFCSTVGDLTMWAGAHCFGSPLLLDDDDRRLLQQAQWQVPGDPNRDYALGFDGTKIGDRRMLGHGGAYPGFITATMFDPADGRSVVVLTNAIDAPSQELASGVVKIVDLAERLSKEREPVGPELVAGFAGRYRSLWRVLDIVPLGRHLVGLDPELADPTQNLIRLVADSAAPGRLRIADGPGFGPVGEPVTIDDAGLRIGGVPMQRVDA